MTASATRRRLRDRSLTGKPRVTKSEHGNWWWIDRIKPGTCKPEVAMSGSVEGAIAKALEWAAESQQVKA